MITFLLTRLTKEGGLGDKVVNYLLLPLVTRCSESKFVSTPASLIKVQAIRLIKAIFNRPDLNRLAHGKCFMTNYCKAACSSQP